MSGSPIDSVSTQELENFRTRMNSTLEAYKKQTRAFEERMRAFDEQMRAFKEALQAAGISVGTKEE